MGFQNIRQIVHGFFTNALKHGQGEIRVRLKTTNASHALTVANRRHSPSSTRAETLALGLRVVDTLLSLDSSLKCRRRHSLNCYAVQPAFPAAEALVDTAPTSFAEWSAAVATQGVQVEATRAQKGSALEEQPAYFRLVAAKVFVHGCPGGGGNTPVRAARTGTRRG